MPTVEQPRSFDTAASARESFWGFSHLRWPVSLEWLGHCSRFRCWPFSQHPPGNIGAAIPADSNSRLAQITPANVGNLMRAWEFHTGDLESRPPAVMAQTKFEATPLFVEDSLILWSPFNEVIALDPGTGTVKWRYDPDRRPASVPPNSYNCRGVAYWADDRAMEGAACAAGYS